MQREQVELSQKLTEASLALLNADKKIKAPRQIIQDMKKVDRNDMVVLKKIFKTNGDAQICRNPKCSRNRRSYSRILERQSGTYPTILTPG